MKLYFNLINRLILGFVLIFAISAQSYAESLKSSEITQKILPVKNGQLAYFRFGQGTPIVLITGFGSTVSEWNKTFLQQLADTHDVIVFDNRDVGYSHFSTRSYTVSNLAEDTAQLITGLKLNKPTVLGWSMGGMVAQQLAIQYPSLIGKLVLMDTAIGGKTAIAADPTVMSELSDTTGTEVDKFNRVMRILFPADAVTEMSKNFEANMFMPEGKPERPVSIQVVKKQQTILEKWRMANNIPAKLRQLKIPTLILTGTADVIIPPQNAAILAQAIPGAKVVEVNNGGHAMMYQYPEKIAEIVSDFSLRNVDKN